MLIAFPYIFLLKSWKNLKIQDREVDVWLHAWVLDISRWAVIVVIMQFAFHLAKHLVACVAWKYIMFLFIVYGSWRGIPLWKLFFLSEWMNVSILFFVTIPQFTHSRHTTCTSCFSRKSQSSSTNKHRKYYVKGFVKTCKLAFRPMERMLHLKPSFCCELFYN